MNKRQRKKKNKKTLKNNYVTIPIWTETTEEKIQLGYGRNKMFFGFSQVGRSHQYYRENCQDKVAISFSDSGEFVVAAISDGVGSCSCAEMGAEIVVREAVSFVLNKVNKGEFTKETAKGIIKGALEIALVAIEKASTQNEVDINEYSATLTIIAFNGNELFAGHVGDDGLILLNQKGQYGLLSTRHKGKSKSSVYPIQCKDMWEYIYAGEVVALVLATDGVLDTIVTSPDENNRVFFPIIEKAVCSNNDSIHEVKALAEEYYAYFINDDYRTVVSDDITFAVISSTGKESQRIPPSFDYHEWKVQNEYYAHDKTALREIERNEEILLKNLPSISVNNN